MLIYFKLHSKSCDYLYLQYFPTYICALALVTEMVPHTTPQHSVIRDCSLFMAMASGGGVKSEREVKFSKPRDIGGGGVCVFLIQ